MTIIEITEFFEGIEGEFTMDAIARGICQALNPAQVDLLVEALVNHRDDNHE